MPGRKVPNSEKRNPCTHMTMTRLYDPWGIFKCSLCQKHPNIGWLYRCTQDTNGFLPAKDFITDTFSTGHTIDPDQDVQLHSLSHPIIKAIGDGHYTTEQIKMLIQQKERVRDIILPQHSRPSTASTSTTSSASTSSSSCIDDTLSTLPHSATFSTTSTTSLDEEIRAAYDWKELNKTWMSEPLLSVADSSTSPLTAAKQPINTEATAPPMVKDCVYKICHNCRPTYRERAMQSLDNVLKSGTMMPPAWELANRRVSDARLLADIQIPQSIVPRYYAQTGWGEPLTSVDSIESAPVLQAPPTGESAITDKHSIRKRSGFRQTVRRALARARSENSDGSLSPCNEKHLDDHTASASGPSVRSQIFRRNRTNITLSFVENHGRVVDTSSLQDSVSLLVARNTPLPGSAVALIDPLHNAGVEGVQDIGNGIITPSEIITQS